MNSFFKLSRKKFSIQVHHNYDVSKLPTNSLLNASIHAFDMLRFLTYMYIGFKIVVKGPQFLTFITLRSGKSLNNNPDFRLCDSEAAYNTFKA